MTHYQEENTMKKVTLTLCLLPLLAVADPAIKNVQVNINNYSEHVVALKSFNASRIFAKTVISAESIAPFSSENKALMFYSFDYDPMHSGLDILVDGQLKKLMWQTNMGMGGSEDPKSHLCGVIKDLPQTESHDYCDIPYVEEGVLIVDFHLNQGKNIDVVR
jgi:hypothetical protein